MKNIGIGCPLFKFRGMILLYIFITFFNSTAFSKDCFNDDLIMSSLNIAPPQAIEPISALLEGLNCYNKKQLLKKNLSHLQSIKDILNKFVSKKPDVWIFGESHEEASLANQPKLLRQTKLADPRIDCLFAEFKPGFEKYWEPGNVSPDDPYKEVAKTASQLGLKIVFVDEYKKAFTHSYDEKSYTEGALSFNVHVRNKGMANEIEKALNSKKCNVGIYIVGKGHQFSTFEKFKVKSLQTFLKESNKTSVNINTISKEGSKNYESDETKCRDSFPSKINKPMGFIQQHTEVDIPLKDYGGLMSDFDATIFFP